jgi:hypothetical protein
MTSLSLSRRRRMRRLAFYQATPGDHLLHWLLFRSVLLAGGPR